MNIKHKLVSGAAKAIRLLPFSAGIYAVAKSYTDCFDGNNNMDSSANGEDFFISRVAPTCRIACDVGANEGQWTERVLKHNPQAIIHCFEPNKACSEILQYKFKHLRERVFVNNFALSNTSGDAQLHYWHDRSQLSSLYIQDTIGLRAMPQKATETVTTDSLEHYCAKSNLSEIDLLKIDTEGAEMPVLMGARALLKNRRIRYIQLEYHATWIYSRYFLRDLFALAGETGYSVFKLICSGTLLRVKHYSQQLDCFQYSNWVLIRPGEFIPGNIITRQLD
jgi:FkbM family methyltransferase